MQRACVRARACLCVVRGRGGCAARAVACSCEMPSLDSDSNFLCSFAVCVSCRISRFSIASITGVTCSMIDRFSLNVSCRDSPGRLCVGVVASGSPTPTPPSASASTSAPAKLTFRLIGPAASLPLSSPPSSALADAAARLGLRGDCMPVNSQAAVATRPLGQCPSALPWPKGSERAHLRASLQAAAAAAIAARARARAWSPLPAVASRREAAWLLWATAAWPQPPPRPPPRLQARATSDAARKSVAH